MAKRELKTKNVVESVEETAEVVETLNGTTSEPVEETVVERVGAVTDCARLNIRKEAKIKADVVTIVNANTNVLVDINKSTKDWYFVKVGKFYGYCMKKYITIES